MLINLHSHLEGRIRPETAAEIAAGAGIPQPDGGWAAALELEGPADLTVYLAKVAASYPFFGRAEHLERITSEAVQDAALDGADYLELRFGPATHVSPELNLDGVIAAVARGATEGMRLSGIEAGVVVAALRHHDQDTNLAVARAAARHAGSGVVGFDLAGDELRFPAIEPHVKAFDLARAAGLGLTCHAAEAAPAWAARQAVDLLGVTRIGHGALIAQDPEALRWAADAGVVIEICPTSNWYTGAIPAVANHPAPVFRRAGIPLVLGDDNPRQTRSLLSAEQRVLVDQLGFTTTDLEAMDRVGVQAAFLDEVARKKLSAKLDGKKV